MGKLNLDDVRESNKELKASRGGGKFLKCQAGKNILRLMPYDSVATGRTRLERAIRRHYKLDNANPLCQKTPAPDKTSHSGCEYCDRVEEIRAQEGDKVAKRMEANKKFVVNAIPLVIGGNPVAGNPTVKQFDAPTTVMGAVLSVLEDCGDPDDYIGLNGCDLVITYDPKADAKKMYEAHFRDAKVSARSSEILAKFADGLNDQVNDLDADVNLLPDWYIEQEGITRPSRDDDDAKPAARPAAAKAAKPVAKKAAAAEPEADDRPAFDTGDDGDAPAEPAAEPEAQADAPAEPDDDDTEPEYTNKAALPRGVTAFWSAGKKKFYFKLPNGTTTFDEKAALAAGGPSKPAPTGKPAAKAAAPVAAKPTAKPAAAKAGKPVAKKGK